MSGDDAAHDLRAWDEIAQTYASQIGAVDDLIYRRFRSFVWRHLGEDVSGMSVLDLGCGHGWLAAELHDQGAKVIGVDGSSELLAIARRHHPALRFVQTDFTDGLPGDIETIGFDRIVAHMVMMDLPDLRRLGVSLRRCVRPDGRVVLTLPHPAFFMQPPVEDARTGERYRKVTGYLQHEQRWITTFGGHRHYHRPLGFYVDWLAEAGFGVVEVFEPPVPWPTPESEWNEYERWFVDIPTMLGLAAVLLR